MAACFEKIRGKFIIGQYLWAVKKGTKWPSASLDFESKCFFALDTFTMKKKSWLQDVTIRQGMAKGARELISCWEVCL